MWTPQPSPYLVPFDSSLRLEAASTRPPEGEDGERENERRLKKLVDELDDLQRKLFAADRVAVLCMFQAMDAAGKDGTIRAVFSGVDPAGVAVHYFKQPSDEELDHDFLWRTTRRLPERGRIGVWNRSYYEEVLVVRVHPEILDRQKLPWRPRDDELWQERFASIREHELHLARNGVVVLKFWLDISRDEQRRRFLARLEEPSKYWKFSERDVRESEHWEVYMRAYEDALRATSRPWAPWYAIPADDKPFARAAVADILVRTLRSLGLREPRPDGDQSARIEEMRRLLGGDGAGTTPA